MFGCESADAALASAASRARFSGSRAMASGTTLIATVRPCCVSRARYTSPRPPAPMRSSSVYFPSFSSIEGDDYNRPPALNPYLAVVRTNRNFRLLYIGQTISQLGDWFNAVAVYALLLDLTGSATAVAWMMIVQFLPIAIVGPMAGVVVDRLDRRRLMIAADI